MRLSDFDFDLPEELIALHPANPRRAARMLVRQGGGMEIATAADLPRFLRAGDLLVFNDTRVIPAQLTGRRLRGDLEAKVEVTLASEMSPGRWNVLAKPARKLAVGDRIIFEAGLAAEVEAREGGGAVLRFDLEGRAFLATLKSAGTLPLPPYISGKRGFQDDDWERYQTVFAQKDGAVAAPTASLHFDDVLLADLDAAGIERVFVTLHVGPGTFLPVKVDNIHDHKMHAEWGEVSPAAAQRINDAKAAGRRVIPVGTTALRLIESAGASGHIQPFKGETDIFITPGYRFRITDGLMTNFHLPKSTLLMLVSALMGVEVMREVYAHAIAKGMRFYSYGDASLLLPK